MKVTDFAPLLNALEDTGTVTENPSDWKIRAVVLHLSADCDLNCRYCYSGAERARHNGSSANMTKETAIGAVDYLLDSGLIDSRGASTRLGPNRTPTERTTN